MQCEDPNFGQSHTPPSLTQDDTISRSYRRAATHCLETVLEKQHQSVMQSQEEAQLAVMEMGALHDGHGTVCWVRSCDEPNAAFLDRRTSPIRQVIQCT